MLESNFTVKSQDKRHWSEWTICEICHDPIPEHQITWFPWGPFCSVCKGIYVDEDNNEATLR